MYSCVYVSTCMCRLKLLNIGLSNVDKYYESSIKIFIAESRCLIPWTKVDYLTMTQKCLMFH